MRSKGGGRGIYKQVDGDFPLAALCGVKTQQHIIPQHIIQQSTIEPNVISHTSIVVWTWNSCGMSCESLSDFFETVKSLRKRWDIILVQEGPHSEENTVDVIEGGHVWCVGAAGDRPRSVAILLHSRWAGHYSQFRSNGGRVCFIDVVISNLNYRFISAHLPHSGYGDLDYAAALEMLGSTITHSQLTHTLVIGVDANAVVGQQSDFDDANIIGKHGLGKRTQRGRQFLAWAKLNGLSLMNTMFSKDPKHLWTHSGIQAESKRQIDYILVPSNYKHNITNAEANNVFLDKTDHRSVFAIMKVQSKKKRGGRNQRPPKVGKQKIYVISIRS